MTGTITCVAVSSFMGPTCKKPATYTTPTGPMCEACALEKMAAIRSEQTMLNVLAKMRGVTTEQILARFRKFDA